MSRTLLCCYIILTMSCGLTLLMSINIFQINLSVKSYLSLRKPKNSPGHPSHAEQNTVSTPSRVCPILPLWVCPWTSVSLNNNFCEGPRREVLCNYNAFVEHLSYPWHQYKHQMTPNEEPCKFWHFSSWLKPMLHTSSCLASLAVIQIWECCATSMLQAEPEEGRDYILTD